MKRKIICVFTVLCVIAGLLASVYAINAETTFTSLDKGTQPIVKCDE